MKSEFLTQGAISYEFITKNIASQSDKHNIGAHSIFIGQVRADVIEENIVKEIEYSCYNEMAEKQFQIIKNKIFDKYNDLISIYIKHSIGIVKSGEISMFIFVSSGHREEAFAACSEVVNLIKDTVPIWGKERFEDDSYIWKKNK